MLLSVYWSGGNEGGMQVRRNSFSVTKTLELRIVCRTARGTRIHDLQSEELVPWLTRGSQGPNFPPHYDPLLPPSTPGSAPSELPPSPGYSRLPMNGHHSAEASQSSISGVLATERVNGELQGEGRVEEGRAPTRQATGDSTRSLPPPYSSGTSGVGTDLSQRRK